MSIIIHESPRPCVRAVGSSGEVMPGRAYADLMDRTAGGPSAGPYYSRAIVRQNACSILR